MKCVPDSFQNDSKDTARDMVTFVDDDLPVPVQELARIAIPGKRLQHADIDETFLSASFSIENTDLLLLKICVN
jgi:hypothetical protein